MDPRELKPRTTSPHTPPRALLVGAGAVGQTWAHHLGRAGAELHLLVKPAHAPGLANAQTLWELGLGRRPSRHALSGYTVWTDPQALTPDAFDVVVLCVSSTALRAGSWLAELGARLGRATLVTLQPGLDDLAWIRRHAPQSPVVQGMIGFLAYEGPLPEEALREAGLRYWLPPGSPSLLSDAPSDQTSDQTSGQTRDAPSPAQAHAALLRRGGMAARVTRSPVEHRSAFLTAAMMPYLAGLELSGWSMRAMRADAARMAQVSQSVQEALGVASQALGVPSPLPGALTRASALSAGTRLAASISPLPLERFLEAHFSKVGEQTLALLRSYVERHEGGAPATQALASELAVKRAG